MIDKKRLPYGTAVIGCVLSVNDLGKRTLECSTPMASYQVPNNGVGGGCRVLLLRVKNRSPYGKAATINGNSWCMFP
jgi:hypothetical protein